MRRNPVNTLLVAAVSVALGAGPLAAPLAAQTVTVAPQKPAHKKQGHDKQRHEAGCMAGTLGGAILGGLLGSTMGKGGGKTAMTVGLAGLGGVAGNSLACK